MIRAARNNRLELVHSRRLLTVEPGGATLPQNGRKEMHISPKALSATILIVSVAGCAGRAPQPVAIVQPTDPYMDCAAI
jgi:hypothetical protein